MEVIKVGGLKTHIFTRKGMARVMLDDCMKYREKKSLPRIAFSSNGQGVSLSNSDFKFKSAMEKADYIHADGQSIVFASKIMCSKALPERVATTDFIYDACEVAVKSGLKFYMLGSTEYENELACKKLLELYPTLEIVGRRNGYFTDDEEKDVIADINNSGADVLWVALGKPKQEFWSINNKEQLQVGWIKTCGGLFGFLSGNASRAPGWMQKTGLEWLHRLIQDPRRLFFRYLTTNIHAICMLALKSK